MNFDELLSIWLPNAEPARAAETPPGATPLVNTALQGLFRRVFESGQPPEWLRPLLAVPHWQATVTPPSCDIDACLTRTEALARTGHRRRQHLRRTAPTRCQHWLPTVVEMPQAISRERALTELDPHVDAVVFHPPGQAPLAFRRHQFEALASALRVAAEAAMAVARRQQTAALLGGAGGLEQCLALTLYPVDASLSVIEYGDVRVVPLLSESRVLSPVGRTLREVCVSLLERTDFDGILIDPYPTLPPSASIQGICWGPDFPRQALAGIDARRPPAACPGRHLKALSDADRWILPGRLRRVRGSDRQSAANCRGLAREVLASMGAGSSHLLRDQLSTAAGAAALRRFPHCGEREWLQRLVRRCEAIEHTRWRVGLF